MTTTRYTVQVTTTIKNGPKHKTVYQGTDWDKAYDCYGATVRDALRGQEVKLSADGKLHIAAAI